MSQMMSQVEILAELHRASSPGCGDLERDEVCNRLVAATSGRLWAAFAVSELFTGCIAHQPEKLPELFPAFALLCGDHNPGGLYPSIDWSLLVDRSTAIR